ncbi:MAG TPA: LysR substrate-binding domain-containing protein [Chryseosolibacter sp.]
MTLTQLEYIVALDTHRHFLVASEHCHVTQPTLSMQIQKLEDELGVKVFDRTKQPVIPTETGVSILAQARVVLREANRIKQIISDTKDTLAGELRIGIIPTLAPYLLPPLYKYVREKYPQINLMIREAITEEIIEELKNNRLDCGLVVTPLKDPSIKEDVLFYEELFVYVSRKNSLADKKYVLPNDINPSQLWLLEEGHCFRSQILNLCELQRRSDLHFKYETGNIETLKRMVDKSDGLTILPELAVKEFSPAQLKLVKQLKDPTPAREVSLVTHRDYIKNNLIKTLKAGILDIVPPEMQKLRNKKVVEIDG